MTKSKFTQYIVKGMSLIAGVIAGFLALDIIHRNVEPEVLAWRGYQAIGGEDLLYIISFILAAYLVYKISCLLLKELSNLYYF